MEGEALQEAIDLARKVGHVFVATSDLTGLPHIASASSLALAPDGRVAVAEWFCPGTMRNLGQNRRVAIVVWDAACDVGYQLLGEVEQVNELAMMDGYAPGKENNLPLMPQVERELLTHIDKVLVFSHAPHSDVEEPVQA
jgi:hypothetical protein